MEIKIPYYEDQSRLNNSSIGWFLYGGPLYFYQKLNKLISEDTSSMRAGRMIHEYILQPDDFWKDYAISDAEAPKSANQKDFCTFIIDNPSLERSESAVEAFKLYYSTKGLSDDKVSEKALELLETLNPWLDFLELKKTKEVMTWSEFNRLKIILENIKLHKKANELLFKLDDDEDWITHNEFHINWDYFSFYTEGAMQAVDCKSLLDRIAIKKDYSEVMLIDIKTTGNVNDFKESFNKYDYGRQMAFYWQAIEYYLEEELELTEEQISKIKRTTYIIAIGSNNEIKVYKIDPDLISERNSIISETISKITWHNSTNKWDYSKEYYEGDGSEILE